MACTSARRHTTAKKKNRRWGGCAINERAREEARTRHTQEHAIKACIAAHRGTPRSPPSRVHSPTAPGELPLRPPKSNPAAPSPTPHRRSRGRAPRPKLMPPNRRASLARLRLQPPRPRLQPPRPRCRPRPRRCRHCASSLGSCARRSGHFSRHYSHSPAPPRRAQISPMMYRVLLALLAGKAAGFSSMPDPEPVPDPCTVPQTDALSRLSVCIFRPKACCTDPRGCWMARMPKGGGRIPDP